jgi:hypothetical protein
MHGFSDGSASLNSRIVSLAIVAREKDDDEPCFKFNSFEKWLERQKIPLPLVRDPKKAHLWLSDFRKFAEPFGDSRLGCDEP